MCIIWFDKYFYISHENALPMELNLLKSLLHFEASDISETRNPKFKEIIENVCY